MSTVFSASELINLAIDVERKGIVFYDVMARSTENEATREAFRYLIGLEREHIQIFQNMPGETGKLKTPKGYSGESVAYLKTLADNAVFSGEMITSEMASRVASDIGALELGIGAEKDSILLYYEIREMMPEMGSDILNKIIAEEKSHLKQLSELKGRLTRAGAQDTD